MTIPLWVLLAFAVWTIAVLMVGIGVRRWTLILTGRAQLMEFPADTPHGSLAYRRAIRAHANCLENLPVYSAIVIAGYASQTNASVMGWLAIVFLIARVLQSLVHMIFTETNLTVFVRFAFFFTQIIAMLWMAVEVARHASL